MQLQLVAGSASVPAAGGSASFTVTAGSGCSWTAATSQSWIAIAGGPAAGSTVSLTVAPNSSTAPRTGTVSVQGQIFTVTQAGAAPVCTYSLSPGSASVPAAGGSASFTVTAGSGCSWTAATSQSWIAIAGGTAAGSTVSLTVAPNSSTASRSGTVSVQGQIFTVTQAGAAPVCTYSLSPGSASVPAAGGSASFTVTAGATCSWTPAASQDWITNLGGSRSGGATVSVTVNPNTSTVPRTGTVSVQGQVFTISQAGAEATCSYRVSPTVFSFPSTGGEGEMEVITGPGCGWTVVSSQSWLVPALTSGSVAAKFKVTARPNNGVTNKSATLTVGPWAVTVFQSGKPRRAK